MARTIIKFKNTDRNLFKVCDSWAKNHRFKVIESSDDSRLYSRREPIISPVQIFIPTKYKVKIGLNSKIVTIECWIDSKLAGEVEVSSSSGFQPLGTKIFKKKLRDHLNDLLTRLKQNDKIVQ